MMEFQLSYFKSWMMMLWKCCTQYASKLGKRSSGHRTRKGQFSFQSQRKAMPKNAQTTTQLHSSHTLVKILQTRLQQYMNRELPDVLEKAEEPEIKLPTSTGSWKKQECSRKISTSALLTMPKPLTVFSSVSVQFSHSVMSDSLQPHELQHARPPCPSSTPGVHSN